MRSPSGALPVRSRPDDAPHNPVPLGGGGLQIGPGGVEVKALTSGFLTLARAEAPEGPDVDKEGGGSGPLGAAPEPCV